MGLCHRVGDDRCRASTSAHAGVEHQLPGVQHETEGVKAEYAYIQKNFPGWKPKTQALLSNEGRQYDSIEIVGPGGATKTIFFDITAWFGK
jgi:hypothetical protein